MRKSNHPSMHKEPLAVRRKLAQDYRRQASNSKLTPQEREAFARMADAWQATLSEN